MRIYPYILDKIKNNKTDHRSNDQRIPLHIEPPSHLDDMLEDIENHKKKNKKSSNDCVININKELNVDFNIEEKVVAREDTWILKIR